MNILLVEDEHSVSSFICKGLKEQGHDVKPAYDGKTGLALALNYEFDVIILDIIMPELNGLEVCKKIRAAGITSTPIIMLTALGTSDDVISGLDTGADDYLAKPFKFQELMARLRALSRRKNLDHHSKRLTIGDLEMNLDSKLVTRSNKVISLTAKEFKLLEYLMQNKGRVLSRIDILERVWDINFDLGTNVVDVYVNYLRKKIDRGFEEKLIHTVIGMGYVLKE